MNTEIRELTVDELDVVSGGLFGPLKEAINQILNPPPLKVLQAPLSGGGGGRGNHNL
jgi:hypothetical protein